MMIFVLRLQIMARVAWWVQSVNSMPRIPPSRTMPCQDASLMIFSVCACAHRVGRLVKMSGQHSSCWLAWGSTFPVMKAGLQKTLYNSGWYCASRFETESKAWKEIKASPEELKYFCREMIEVGIMWRGKNYKVIVKLIERNKDTCSPTLYWLLDLIEGYYCCSATTDSTFAHPMSLYPFSGVLFC